MPRGLEGIEGICLLLQLPSHGRVYAGEMCVGVWGQTQMHMWSESPWERSRCCLSRCRVSPSAVPIGPLPAMGSGWAGQRAIPVPPRLTQPRSPMARMEP